MARPADPDDVVRLVEWARAEGMPLVPRGSGTGMPGGNVGRGVVVDLAGWDRIGEPCPETRTVVVGPGAVAADVDRAAASVGLTLPPLPSSAERCTVGGMIANNAAGARTFGWGAVRDWVEALDVVLADGTRVTLEAGRAPDPDPLARLRGALAGYRDAPWPDVRKNSSGYALDRFLASGRGLDLLVGSEGTLAIVTGARLRLAPRPRERRLVLVALPRLDDLTAGAEEARAVGASVCEFLGRSFVRIAALAGDPAVGSLVADAEAVLLVELDDASGCDPDVGAARLARWAEGIGAPVRTASAAVERERLWAVRHAASPVIAARAEQGLVSMQFIEDSSLPMARMVRYLRALEAILEREETDAVFFGHAGDGNVHVNPLVDVARPDWKARVRRILLGTADLVASLGGTLSGEHGDGRIRSPLSPRVWGPAWTAAFATVKETLDPAGILNPGVIVARPGQDPLDGIGPWPRRR